MSTLCHVVKERRYLKEILFYRIQVSKSKTSGHSVKAFLVRVQEGLLLAVRVKIEESNADGSDRSDRALELLLGGVPGIA